MRVDLWWDEAVPGQDLLRRAAADRLGVPTVEVVRWCPRCGTADHGRPVVPSAPHLGLSLARAGDAVVVATVVDASVGVDVEPADVPVDGLSGVLLAPDDAPHADAADLRRTWVRKEAVLKAAGSGLAVDPAHVVTSGPRDEPRLVGWASPLLPDPRPLALLDLGPRHGLPHGLVAALAVTGTSRGPVVVVRRPTSAGR